MKINSNNPPGGPPPGKGPENAPGQVKKDFESVLEEQQNDLPVDDGSILSKNFYDKELKRQIERTYQRRAAEQKAAQASRLFSENLKKKNLESELAPVKDKKPLSESEELSDNRKPDALPEQASDVAEERSALTRNVADEVETPEALSESTPEKLPADAPEVSAKKFRPAENVDTRAYVAKSPESKIGDNAPPPADDSPQFLKREETALPPNANAKAPFDTAREKPVLPAQANAGDGDKGGEEAPESLPANKKEYSMKSELKPEQPVSMRQDVAGKEQKQFSPGPKFEEQMQQFADTDGPGTEQKLRPDTMKSGLEGKEVRAEWAAGQGIPIASFIEPPAQPRVEQAVAAGLNIPEIERLVDNVLVGFNSSGQPEFKMDVNLAELGNLSVKITKTELGLAIHFNAETERAGWQLGQNLQQLQAILAQKGLSVNNLQLLVQNQEIPMSQLLQQQNVIQNPAVQPVNPQGLLNAAQQGAQQFSQNIVPPEARLNRKESAKSGKERVERPERESGKSPKGV